MDRLFSCTLSVNVGNNKPLCDFVQLFFALDIGLVKVQRIAGTKDSATTAVLAADVVAAFHRIQNDFFALLARCILDKYTAHFIHSFRSLACPISDQYTPEVNANIQDINAKPATKALLRAISAHLLRVSAPSMGYIA